LLLGFFIILLQLKQNSANSLSLIFQDSLNMRVGLGDNSLKQKRINFGMFCKIVEDRRNSAGHEGSEEGLELGSDDKSG
jgi:hypothetical protein